MAKSNAGRPSEYSNKILEDAKKYLKECVDGYKRIVQSQNKKRKIYTTKFQVKLPTIGGLAVYLHISRDTIYDWKKKHKEFSYIIDEMMAEQEDRLINSGISGDYNATISKVLLTKHGYREGHEVANPDGTNVFRPSDADKKAAEKALEDL